jgi:hypothetical protein
MPVSFCESVTRFFKELFLQQCLYEGAHLIFVSADLFTSRAPIRGLKRRVTVRGLAFYRYLQELSLPVYQAQPSVCIRQDSGAAEAMLCLFI